MKIINLLQPSRIVFGNGCAGQCASDLLARGLRRIFVITTPPVLPSAEPLVAALKQGGASVMLYSDIVAEPTTGIFERVRALARDYGPDAVLGIGGGSAMDVAKLVAALHDSQQDVRQVLGINLVASRRTYLACLPTTAGTGSEVSPNAILLDEAEHLKKGAVSPHLVPDAAYVDPLLTLDLPPAITAATGLDALTHCIEEYANINAHPIMDLLSLEGVRLIGANLLRAVENGHDEQARAHMALGSLYGGLGLGTVNTAAVHALAYPLGGEFHVPHGVSNVVLLPHVCEFNLPAAPQRYADIALALGVEPSATVIETAQRGVQRIRELSARCGMPRGMAELGVPKDAIPRMAQAAMTVKRLLKNNLRELTVEDAEAIYRAAY